MSWESELGLHALALLGYPGLVAALLLGGSAESLAAWALVPERGGPLVAGGRVMRSFRQVLAAPGAPLLSQLAILLALLAGMETGIPYNPVPSEDRDLLTAGVALAGAAWLVWCWGWGEGELDVRLMLRIQLCWLVALLAPAIVPQTLHPGTLGVRQLPLDLPVKVAGGLLYLTCLPALLLLIPESAPQGVPGGPQPRRLDREQAGMSALRVFLWLPYCALFATLFFAPLPEGFERLDGLYFAAVTVATGAIALLAARGLILVGAAGTRRFYTVVVVPFAVLTVTLGMLSALLSYGPR